MSILGVSENDNMIDSDDNRLTIYVVPDVSWATKDEWQQYLAATDHYDRQRIKEKWYRRSGVQFSTFESLAHTIGIVSLRDEPPTDEVMGARAKRHSEFCASVNDAIAAVVELNVSRYYGRCETTLGTPFSGVYWRTGYLEKHVDIIEWATRQVYGESSGTPKTTEQLP